MNRLPRLLLVTDVVPGRGSVGREYLRAACRLLPRDRIAVFDFDPGGREALAPELAGLQMHHEPSPDRRGPRKRGNWAWRRHLDERRREQLDVPALVSRIVSYGREHGVERVWVPLHSPTTVRVAKRVADGLGLPLITTTWDPPDYKLGAFGVGRRMRRHLLRLFDEANRHACACSAASEPMRDLYERLYGTPTVTMILGAPRPPTLPAPPADGPGRPLRIGFAGSLYARAEFDAFRAALDRLDWRVGDRPVELDLFGDHEALAASNGATRIRSHGWCDPDEAVARIARCHAAYLPYWFARRRREVVEVSFPGKLALYAAARTPVFYHGPAYGSPVRFLERFPLGKVCASPNPPAVAELLAGFLGDAAGRAVAREQCDRAYEAELSAAVFRARFAKLLDVPASELLPLETRAVPAGERT